MSLKKVLNNYSKRDRNLSMLFAGLISLVIVVSLVQNFIYNLKISDSGSVYNEGLVGELTQINPLFRDISNINRDISSLIYSGLTKYNPETKTFEPDLATFTINEDSTSFVFTLKEDLKWSDGKEITVDDILYTYRTVAQNPGFQNTILRENLEGVTIEFLADNQIEFKLSNPNAFFISQTDLGIIPKHIYESVAINEIGKEVEKNELKLIVGSGPYKLNSIDKLDETLTRVNLRLNKNYDGQEPKINTVRFFISPTSEDLISYQNNINSIANLNFSEKEQIDQEKFSFNEYLLPQYTALFLNLDKEVMKDREVRVVLKRGANPQETTEGLNDKQTISRPFFQYEAINEISETDPTVLKDILESANWNLNDDNIYEKNALDLNLDLAVQTFAQNEIKNQEFQKLINNLVKTYSKVGIKLNPQFYQGDQFAQVIADRDYDLVLLGHNLGNNLDSYSFWHSSQANSQGLNLSNYRNIATDSLLERVRTTSDISERKDLLVKINEKLVFDVPAIFLYTDKHIFAIDNKLKNRKILPSYTFTSDRFYDIASWEIN
jgi:peptide/nickel transport system substrate-binding protein